jgi:hypothetical protein
MICQTPGGGLPVSVNAQVSEALLEIESRLWRL